MHFSVVSTDSLLHRVIAPILYKVTTFLTQEETLILATTDKQLKSIIFSSPFPLLISPPITAILSFSTFLSHNPLLAIGFSVNFDNITKTGFQILEPFFNKIIQLQISMTYFEPSWCEWFTKLQKLHCIGCNIDFDHLPHNNLKEVILENCLAKFYIDKPLPQLISLTLSYCTIANLIPKLGNISNLQKLVCIKCDSTNYFEDLPTLFHLKELEIKTTSNIANLDFLLKYPSLQKLSLDGASMRVQNLVCTPNSLKTCLNLEEITLVNVETLNLNLITSLPLVRKITLEDSTLNLTNIIFPSQLEELSLINCSTQGNLTFSPLCKLRLLNLYETQDNGEVQYLKDCPLLEELNLGCEFIPLDQVQYCSNLTKLRKLTVSRIELGTCLLLPFHSTLTELCLLDCGIIIQEKINMESNTLTVSEKGLNLDEIKSCVSLRKLSIESYVELVNFEAVKYLPFLEEISLRNHSLEDISPLALCKTLRIVRFRRCSIHNLEVLSACPNLKEFYFKDGQIPCGLTPFVDYSALEVLSIKDSQCDYDLAELKSCSKLKVLILTDCVEINNFGALNEMNELQYVKLTHPGIMDKIKLSNLSKATVNMISKDGRLLDEFILRKPGIDGYELAERIKKEEW
jgi:hypothetical protein